MVFDLYLRAWRILWRVLLTPNINRCLVTVITPSNSPRPSFHTHYINKELEQVTLSLSSSTPYRKMGSDYTHCLTSSIDSSCVEYYRSIGLYEYMAVIVQGAGLGIIAAICIVIVQGVRDRIVVEQAQLLARDDVTDCTDDEYIRSYMAHVGSEPEYGDDPNMVYVDSVTEVGPRLDDFDIISSASATPRHIDDITTSH